MDRFEVMSMLLVVVEQGSLSAAGRVLRVPVATLSRKVSELEALLGARLLIRTTRKLTLTDAGATYVSASRRILEQLEAAEREVAGEYSVPRGELVLTAPLMFGRLYVLPVVTDFLKRFPDIDVRLSLSDRNAHLVDDHVDMAVRIGSLPESSLMATRVGEMRSVFCASPQFLAKHGEPRSPADLGSIPCIGVDDGSPLTALSVRGSDGQPQEVRVRTRLRVSTAEAAADAAMLHLGLCRLLHYQAADAIERGALRLVLQAHETAPAPIHLLHASRGQMPLKMRVFLDFAAPRLRKSVSKLNAPQRGARKG